MADVRCPMCGKTNPAELEVCQFCQARLKPLRVNPSQEGDFSPSDTPGEQNDTPGDVPDWLHSLRQPGDDDFSDESDQEDELPDWLSQPENSDEGDLPEAPSGEPDWLSGLRDRSSMMDESPGTEEEDQDIAWNSEEDPAENAALPDWLASMRSGNDSALQDEGESEELAAPAEEEPEWLLKIRSHTDSLDDQMPSEAESPASGETEDVSAFTDLKDDVWSEKESIQASSQVPAFDDLDLSDVPDWLSEGDSDQPFETDSDVEEDSISEWLPKTDEAVFSEENFPQNLGSTESEINSEPEAEQAEEIPDWLAELGQGADQVGEEEDSASWLDFGEEESRPEPEDGRVVKPFQDEDSQEIISESTSVDSREPFEEEISAGELPDWLAELGDQPVEAEQAEMPDWDIAAEDQTSPDELETSFEVTELDDEALEWLEEAGASISDGDALDTASESKPVAPFALEGDLDNLDEPISAGEVPEWLEEVAPSKGLFGEEDFEGLEFDQELFEGESQPDLPQANLPNWVEAMRPVEASTTDAPKVDENSNLIESIGPLAGLRGVLPAEPDISQVKKPPAYLIKLQVTDAQKANAALLEQMIKTEAQPRAIPKRPAISSQHILRIVIAIVLIFAVVWPLVMGGPQLPPPAFSPEAVVTGQLVTAMNPDSPVLLAVDYEPGWSGEMDAVAAPVIDHLMLRGAFFALVSTTPSGPPQAEQLMSFVSQHEAAQLPGDIRYANLGFIPGGPAGLLSFAQTPQQVLPVSQDGTHVWESGPLANVKSLADFGMVVVVTENPQTARAWIEQVRPSMRDVPLVMVTSAQAEPLVRPYYDAVPQQVQGMISGLAGGLAYENLTGRSGAAGAYWNAFGLGLAVAGALIIIGGIFNAGLALYARSKENVEGED